LRVETSSMCSSKVSSLLSARQRARATGLNEDNYREWVLVRVLNKYLLFNTAVGESEVTNSLVFGGEPGLEGGSRESRTAALPERLEVWAASMCSN
jgi:hypothetical protein